MSHVEDKQIEGYRQLIAQFVGGQLSADQFETLFLHSFKAETIALPERVFAILDDLFLDVDAYCGAGELRSKTNLDASQLKERAAEALKQLSRIEGKPV